MQANSFILVRYIYTFCFCACIVRLVAKKKNEGEEMEGHLKKGEIFNGKKSRTLRHYSVVFRCMINGVIFYSKLWRVCKRQSNGPDLSQPLRYNGHVYWSALW